MSVEIRFETSNSHEDHFIRSLTAVRAEAQIDNDLRFAEMMVVSNEILEDVMAFGDLTDLLRDRLLRAVYAGLITPSGLLDCVREGHPDPDDPVCLRCGRTTEPGTYLDTAVWEVRRV